MLPDGLEAQGDLHTGLAYDNQDMYVDTLNGKGTLHLTASICYQDMKTVIDRAESASNGDQRDSASSLSLESTNRRRRRRFSADAATIEPFHKSIRINSETMVELDDPRRKVIAPSFEKSITFDFTWLALISMKIPNVPMWTGWNSQLVDTVHPQQIIRYMPPIDASPTSDSVVAETLKMSQRIAAECDQTYIPVTYDLAIYKRARGIQSVERPTYDNIFFLLGKCL